MYKSTDKDGRIFQDEIYLTPQYTSESPVGRDHEIYCGAPLATVTPGTEGSLPRSGDSWRHGGSNADHRSGTRAGTRRERY